MIIKDELGPTLIPSLYVSNIDFVCEISCPEILG